MKCFIEWSKSYVWPVVDEKILFWRDILVIIQACYSKIFLYDCIEYSVEILSES